MDPAAPDKSTPLHGWKLLVEYDGTAYCGWQRQAHSPSIQQTLEEALEKITRHPVRCPGAGRTDTGVHAAGQVARFTTPRGDLSSDNIRRGGNFHLPDDIRIVRATPCHPEFDPRRDARRRAYRYSVLNRPSPPAIARRQLAHVPGRIDWAAIEQGLARLRGRHDFRPFRSAGCQAGRTVLDLTRAEHIDDHPVHHFDFECRSFLHSQIRFMVGLLLAIGRGRYDPDVISRAFETGSLDIPFRVAPPQGLTLVRVDYDDPGQP